MRRLIQSLTACSFLAVMPWVNLALKAQDPFAEDDSATVLKKVLEQLQKNNNTAPLPDNKRSIGIAQSKTELPPPPPAYELRIYDLADLFAIAPSSQARGWEGQDVSALLGERGRGLSNLSSIPASSGMGGGGMGGGGMGGGMGGMGGGMFNVGLSGSAQEPANEGTFQPTPPKLISVIQEMIPGEWRSGKEKISWIGSSLIVSALPETHTSMQRLLDLLQQRWNAKVTLQVQLDWVWLKREEVKQFQELPPFNEEKGNYALVRSKVEEWLQGLPKVEGRPESVTARMQCYNGQAVSWVSGAQKRTVANWIRGEKGKLISEPVAMQTGVACELCPMLAHASNNVTLDLRSRYIWRLDKPNDAAKNGQGLTNPANIEQASSESMPRPDQDPVSGQTISSTVRIPVGSATLVGGGTSIESDIHGWELYLIAGTEFGSPPERKLAQP